MLPRMVWLTKQELVFILDALDYYSNEALSRRGVRHQETLGDIREKIVLARYGKVRKSDMPAVRSGKRIPPHSRKRKRPVQHGPKTKRPKQKTIANMIV